MRNTFASMIEEFASKDDAVILLSADLGFSVFDKFQETHPDQYMNVGIAENTAISMAAGMALGGLKPYVYSIASFITAKCLEQIKEDVCLHDAPVVFVGTGAGFAYGTAGYTHFALDDISVLSTVPGLTIVSPVDSHELKLLMQGIRDLEKPVYVRIGKSSETIYSSAESLSIGQSYFLKEGTDVALVVHGDIVKEVCEAADILKNEGIETAIVSSPTILPLDTNFFDELSKNYKHIFVIEEHYERGGLGDLLSDYGVQKIAVPIKILKTGGDLQYLREQSSIDAKSIAKRVARFIRD